MRRRRAWGRVVVALVALAFAAAVPTPAASGSIGRADGGGPPEIIGGDLAPPGSFGYQVALLARDTPDAGDAFFCGGALISPDTVLTAAHCVSASISPFSRPDQIDVLAGTLDLGSGGRRVHVRRIRVHPAFATGAPRHDVAVLQLWATLPDPLTVPATAADGGLAAPGTYGAVAGWGSTSNTGRYPAHLRWASLRIRYDRVCEERMPQAFDATTMLCVGGPVAGLGSCWGDSGGPLVVESEGRTVQVGIVSFGATDSCADGNPEAFTRVSRAAGFVTPYLDPDTPPDPPDGLTGRPRPRRVDLAWTTPSFDGGAAVKGYELRWDTVPPAVDGPTVVRLGRLARSYAVTGLLPGQRYRFEVRAFNVVGDGAARTVDRTAG